MDIETFKFPIYVCGCGYRTGHSSNATRHKKVSCGCGYKTPDNGNASKHKKVACGHSMTNELTEVVLKKDYDIVVGKPGNNIVTGDNSTVNIGNDNSTTIITNNSVVNDTPMLSRRTTEEDFVDYREPI